MKSLHILKDLVYQRQAMYSVIFNLIPNVLLIKHIYLLPVRADSAGDNQSIRSELTQHQPKEQTFNILTCVLIVWAKIPILITLNGKYLFYL